MAWGLLAVAVVASSNHFCHSPEWVPPVREPAWFGIGRHRAYLSASLLACALALNVCGCRRSPGQCDVEEVATARARLEDLDGRFEDAERLASVTSRIALAGPVSKLQEIKREAATASLPPCLRRAQYLLTKRMDLVLSGFMLFMADSDSGVASALANETARGAREDFRQALADVSLCAPECGHLDGWTAQGEEDQRAARARVLEQAREKQVAEERDRQRELRAAEEERLRAAESARRERVATLRDEMHRWNQHYREAMEPLRRAIAEWNASGASPHSCADFERQIERTRQDRRMQAVPDEDVRQSLQAIFNAYSTVAEVCTNDPTLRDAQAKVITSALSRFGRYMNDYGLPP